MGQVQAFDPNMGNWRSDIAEPGNAENVNMNTWYRCINWLAAVLGVLGVLGGAGRALPAIWSIPVSKPRKKGSGCAYTLNPQLAAQSKVPIIVKGHGPHQNKGEALYLNYFYAYSNHNVHTSSPEIETLSLNPSKFMSILMCAVRVGRPAHAQELLGAPLLPSIPFLSHTTVGVLEVVNVVMLTVFTHLSTKDPCCSSAPFERWGRRIQIISEADPRANPPP